MQVKAKTATKLANDATASTKGTVYNLYVALQKAFEMVSGQKVILERYGDVTMAAAQQIEVKLYADELTDAHINFWKTLDNWMKPGFDESAYSSFVLCTTQQISTSSELKNWNASSPENRMQILTKVYNDGKAREDRRLQDPEERKKPSSESFRLQSRVMEPSQNDKLKRIVTRFVIADSSPDLDGTFAILRDVQGKYVLKGKCDDFLAGLLGFVICPTVLTGSSWEITYDAFSNKVRELTSIYRQGTTYFPTKFRRLQRPTADEIAERNDLFVKKIREIQYLEVIPKAVMDYLYASDTVMKELQDYNLPPDAFTTFANSVRDQFEPNYTRALRSVRDVILDSKNFYDKMMAEPVPAFPGFDQPDFSFRNGVVHMHCDDKNGTMKWRLAGDE